MTTDVVTSAVLASAPERSPSPPIPLTPGYLATRLRTLFDNALSHTLKTCSYDNFAACFPTPAARRADVLRSVWMQIAGKIESKANNEFEGIMGERDVVRGLNELEALIEQARLRKERGQKMVAPHTLPPEALYQAHLAPQLEPVARQLQEKIEHVSTENERLANGISKQRDEVAGLIRHLEEVVKDLEGANGTLGVLVEEAGLRQEVLDVQKNLTEVGSKL